MLPSCQQVLELETEQLWHIEYILFDAFLDLHNSFKDQIKPVANILLIPVLPAMHIDELSLEGTLHVLETIITKTLKLESNGLEKHGIIFCVGDQLTLSFLDKVRYLALLT